MKVTVYAADMPFKTAHFNKGQRVWLMRISGDAAAKVVGQFRGRGLYTRAWINWGHAGRPQPDFKPVEVEDMFAARLELSSKAYEK